MLVHALLELGDVGVERLLLLCREQCAHFRALLLHQRLHLVASRLRGLEGRTRRNRVTALTGIVRRLEIGLERLPNRLELRMVLLVDGLHLVALRLRQLDAAEETAHSRLVHLAAIPARTVAAAELALPARRILLRRCLSSRLTRREHRNSGSENDNVLSNHDVTPPSVNGPVSSEAPCDGRRRPRTDVKRIRQA